MKHLLLVLSCLLPSLSYADFTCDATQIREWPLNPYVTVTSLGGSKYEVLVQRSYYGYYTGGPFTAKLKKVDDVTLSFKGKADQLTIFAGENGYTGVLETAEYGQESLNCKLN